MRRCPLNKSDRNMASNKYPIHLTSAANEDLAGIIDDILSEYHSTQATSEWLDRFEKTLDRISRFPDSCPVVSDPFLRLKGYRHCSMGNHVLFYIVDHPGHRVIVMRILYARRQHMDFL